MDNLTYLAKNLSVLYTIPVRTYINNQKELYFLYDLIVDPVDLELTNIKQNAQDCFIYSTSYLWFYGVIKNKDNYLIIGPIGNLNLNQYDMSRIFFGLSKKRDDFNSFLNSIKQINNLSLSIFTELLCLYYFSLTGKQLYYHELYNEDFAHFNYSPVEIDNNLEKKRNSSISFELEMIKLVKSGDTNKLKEFLLTTNYGDPGKAVSDPLRQAKNYFCSTITLVSREAIKSGMDENTALNLSDTYIQQSELASTIEATYMTLFKALLDYTERIGQFSHSKRKYSLTTKKAIQFMLNNITNNVSSFDFAEQENISESNFRLTFKRETGLSFHKYFIYLKIEEAKRLLLENRFTLIDIAYRLDFSSQSHFQNVFKSIVGMTPLDYVKTNQ